MTQFLLQIEAVFSILFCFFLMFRYIRERKKRQKLEYLIIMYCIYNTDDKYDMEDTAEMCRLFGDVYGCNDWFLKELDKHWKIKHSEWIEETKKDIR